MPCACWLSLYACRMSIEPRDCNQKFYCSTGPAFWGLINPEWSLCNKGRRQSPVNLEPQRLLFDPNLRPLHIDKHRVSIILRLFWLVLNVSKQNFTINENGTSRDARWTLGWLDYGGLLALTSHFVNKIRIGPFWARTPRPQKWQSPISVFWVGLTLCMVEKARKPFGWYLPCTVYFPACSTTNLGKSR